MATLRGPRHQRWPGMIPRAFSLSLALVLVPVTSSAQPRVHVDARGYDHQAFRPWRLQALAFKALRSLRPDYPLWRDFPYEYEQGRLAIDVINGSELLRQWVDDSAATPADLDALAARDEAAWAEERRAFLLY